MLTEAMTREQVKAASGRALDELVVEHVFGIQPRRVRIKGSTEFVKVWTDNPALCDGIWDRQGLELYGSPSQCSSGWTGVGLVITEMARRGWSCTIHVMVPDDESKPSQTRVDFHSRYVLGEGLTSAAYADSSAAVAVCKCALLAIGGLYP